MSNGICVFTVIHSSFIDHNVNSKIIYICSIFSSKITQKDTVFKSNHYYWIINHHHLTHNYTKPSSTHPKKSPPKHSPQPSQPHLFRIQQAIRIEGLKKENNQPVGMLTIMSRSFLGCFFQVDEILNCLHAIYTTNRDFVLFSPIGWNFMNHN